MCCFCKCFHACHVFHSFALNYPWPCLWLWAIFLIQQQLCSWDPLKRPTAEQALQHPFFQVSNWSLLNLSQYWCVICWGTGANGRLVHGFLVQFLIPLSIGQSAWVSILPEFLDALPDYSGINHFGSIFCSTAGNPNLELYLWDFDNNSDDCFLGLTLAVNPSVSNSGMISMPLLIKWLNLLLLMSQWMPCSDL